MRFHSIVSAVVAVTADLAAADPTVPSSDSFYVQPANISRYKPGAIVKSRNLGNQIQGLLPLASVTVGAVYEYMYRTTDSIGNPVGSVMTYLVPENPDNTKLLSFSIEYDCANVDSSPSYSIQPGANHSIGYDLIFLQAALNNGWHVVTSDYEGLQAQFTAGVQSGNAAIDSIRAALNSTVRQSTQLSATAKYALYGYSGGAIAAEWAAEMVPSYAPELSANLVGIAIGGLPPNLTSVLVTLNKTPGAGLVFAASYGLAKAYPSLAVELNKTLIPSKSAQYYDIAGNINPGGPGLFQDLFSYFTGGMALLQEPVVKSSLAAGGQMGTHGVPKIPMFVYKAIGDEVSPVADTDKLMAQYCNQGVKYEYQRNTFGGHLTEALLGGPPAFAWLKDRFAGVALNSNPCLVENVTIANVAQSGAAAQFGNAVASLLQVTLGNPSLTYLNNTNATMFA